MNKVKVKETVFDLSVEKERVNYSEALIKDKLLGKTIKSYGILPGADLKNMGWKIKGRAFGFEFTDNTTIIPVECAESQRAANFIVYPPTEKNFDFIGGVIMSTGYLSKEQTNSLKFRKRAPFISIRLKTGEYVCVVAQNVTNQNDAATIIGSCGRENWVLSPLEL
jgi:hypothetical protein